MDFIFLFMWISLTVSQSAMDFMSTLIVLWTVVYIVKHRADTDFTWKIGLEKLWLPWLFIFFAGIFVAVPIHSINWVHATEMKWILVFYSFIFFYKKQAPWEDPKHLQRFCLFLAFASAHAAFASLIDYDFILQKKLSDETRAGGFFDDPMGFAHIFGQFFVFLFAWILSRTHLAVSNKISLVESIKKNSLYILTALLTGFGVLLSLTRGIWMAAAVAGLISAFVINRKWGWFSFLAAMSFMGILFAIWPMFRERILFVFDASHNYDGERMWLWKSNWHMFLDHPLLGVGYGEYHQWLPIYFEKLGAPANQQLISHSHNQYLHFLSNTGFLGGLFYILFLGFILFQTYKIYNKIKTTPEAHWVIGSLAAQCCFILGGLTECNFERAKMRLTYLALAAIPFAINLKLKIRGEK